MNLNANKVNKRLYILNNHIQMNNTSSKLTIEDVQSHNNENDAWVIINKKIYDITNFLSHHPGGKMILLKASGTDATDDFEMLHNNNVLQKFSSHVKYIGDIQ